MTSAKSRLAALFAASLVAAAPAALARSADGIFPDEVQIVVGYGDLNLATPEGAHALRARVDRAAVRVKGETDPRDLAGMAELRKARAAAQDAADAIIQAHQGAAYARLHEAPSKLGL